MVRRRISEAQRWQIIGMHTTGMSFKAIGRQMGYHYTGGVEYDIYFTKYDFVLCDHVLWFLPIVQSN